MRDPSPGDHAAATAWVEGRLDAAQRDEFEAHLATCAQCQSEVARALQESRRMKALKISEAKQPRPTPPLEPRSVSIQPAAPPKLAKHARRISWWWWLLAAAAVTLIGGFGLGWWTWLLAHD